MKVTTWMLAVALCLVASSASAGSIAYSKWAANRHHIMIMDETGADPTEIYAGAKFSPYRPSPTISTPTADGTWVAWSEGTLYKIREDGTDLSTVLCDGNDGGAFQDGLPYLSIRDAQWSPLGADILVQTLQPDGSTYLGLVPADFTVGADCTLTDLVLIYDGMDDGFGIEGTAAWNDDGTQIAFFEIAGPWNEGGIIRLVILERQETGDWVAQSPPLYPDLPEVYPLDLDWQSGRRIGAFASRDETGRKTAFWLTYIDTTTGSWGYLTHGGDRLKGTSPTWSPEGSRLIFSDDRTHLVQWTGSGAFDGEGFTEVIGSGADPDWQAELSTCADASDCDDGNPCTNDACIGGICDNTANTDLCDDGNPCTFADVCSEGSCSGTPILDGYDPGCAGWCCDGECWEGAVSCESTCSAKGEPCLSNDDCCSGLCHPIKGTCK